MGVRILKSFWHVGRAIKPETVPTKLRRIDPPASRAKLLDVNAQMGLVWQTFKDIVEEFEPDLHQFFSNDVLQQQDHRGDWSGVLQDRLSADLYVARDVIFPAT